MLHFVLCINTGHHKHKCIHKLLTDFSKLSDIFINNHFIIPVDFMNQKYGLSLATALVSISMITIAVRLDPMPYSSNIIIISAAHATPLADVNVKISVIKTKIISAII